MTDKNLAKELLAFYHKHDAWPTYQKQLLEKWQKCSEEMKQVKGYSLVVGMIKEEQHDIS